MTGLRPGGRHVDRHPELDRRPAARCTFDSAPSPGDLRPFPHEGQAEVAGPALDLSRAVAHAIVGDLRQAAAADVMELDPDGRGPGVLAHVNQRLPGGAVD